MDNPTLKRMRKQKLLDLIEDIVSEINQIREFYGRLFMGAEDKVSLVKDIEDKYQNIVNTYNELFGAIEGGLNKVAQVNQQVKEIKDYHAALLEVEDSISADIEDSQKRINEFYNFLFFVDESVEGDKSNEGKTKGAIQSITEFKERLDSPGGIREHTEAIYSTFAQKYSELFEAPEGKKSKISRLDTKISSIEDFNKKVKAEIEPEIDNTRKEIKNLQGDIDTKKQEIDALLFNVTGATLAEGYLQSKTEYSKRAPTKYKAINEAFRKSDWKWNQVENYLYLAAYNSYVLLDNLVFRHIGQLVAYTTFILPLVMICIIFLLPKTVFDTLGITFLVNTFSVTEFMIYKTVVSLPLLWISWFGQRSISIRRRLSEEYNHKYRVTQMYLMFSTKKGDSFPLDDDSKADLAKVLIDAIKHNPADNLGKGETMIDHLPEITGRATSEVVNKVKSTLETTASK